MPGISDLVNNITGSVNGLIDDLKGRSKPVVEYHNGESAYKNIQSELNPESWMKLSFPYTFSVVNVDDPSDDFTSGFTDFKLPLAPQSINQREEPATVIKPSQGGTTVNHNGMGYKVLTISGTTGLAPFRGDGGVNKKTGEAIFQPKELKFKSGYEVFIHLRNWFRTYYEWKKKTNQDSKQFRLVFKNYKDGEFLIVELISFEMDRQAAKSFLYDYKLEFKVLSHFQFSTPYSKLGFLDKADAFIDDALNKLTIARGVLLRTQGILRQVESTYNNSVLEPMRQATLALKAALAIKTVAADIGSRMVANTVSTFAALKAASSGFLNMISLGALGSKLDDDPKIVGLLDFKTYGKKDTFQKTMDAAMTAIEQNGSVGLFELGALMLEMDTGVFPEKTLSDLADEQEQATELPRSYFEDALAELERVKQNAEDFFSLGSDEYDEIFDRTSTLTADPSKTVTSDEYDILNAMNEAIIAYDLILSASSLFKASMDSQIEDMNTRFNGQLELNSRPAVRQVILKAGQSLERLAQRELGDSTRWGEIVEINGLNAPYVSDDPFESRVGVLKAGSSILIPAALRDGFSQVPTGKGNKLTKNMTEIEKNLGVDLKVDKDFDLVITSSGDFELVAGADNMTQGTILKLSYEPGDVMQYPTLGAGMAVGSKFPPIEDLTDRVTSSLLQDSRINKVTDISITRDGPALYMRFNIYIKQVDLPVPVKIKI